MTAYANGRWEALPARVAGEGWRGGWAVSERPLRLLDLFAGLSGFSVAAHRVGGFETAAFVEINPFCRKVLAQRWPGVPCFEDIRTVTAESLRDAGVGRIDAISFGFPCQDLSVAGQRSGLSGERSGLFWEACRLVDTLRPDWLIAENVPGLRSSDEGRDMARVVGAFAELGYVGAWRSLDAQYAGLAQRRERVFFVGGLGDRGRRAVHALLEGGSRHPAPRRKEGQRVAGTFNARASAGGGFSTDFDCDGGLIPTVANPLTQRMCTGVNTTCDEGQTMVAPSLRAKANDPHRADMAAYVTGTLGTEMGRNRGLGQENETSLLVTHTLRGEGFDGSEDGSGRGTPLVAYGLGCHAGTADGDTCNRAHSNGGPSGMGISEELAHSIRAERVGAVAFQPRYYTRDNKTGGAPSELADLTNCAKAGDSSTAVAFQESQSGLREYADAGCFRANGPGHDPVGTRIRTGAMVRRLSPTEAERLMGFSYRDPHTGEWQDGWTCLCGKNKGRSAGEEPCRCPDGPRYRSLGNSVAIPCVEFVLRAILAADAAK